MRLPVKIARSLSIGPGDEFFWRVSDELPGIIQLVPAEVVERRYAVGETLERLDTASASEDPLTEIAEAGEQDCSSTES
ncbi:MAG: hypothetical protein IV096_00205 [Microbacterium sp.]|nr:hypothetical protein [Microbacterium sp.]TLF29782.1 hypothetical protein FE256_12125 [Microbacterium sp. 5K110]